MSHEPTCSNFRSEYIEAVFGEWRLVDGVLYITETQKVAGVTMCIPTTRESRHVRIQPGQQDPNLHSNQSLQNWINY